MSAVCICWFNFIHFFYVSHYYYRPANLYTAEDFGTFTASGDVELDMYTDFSPAQQMQDRASKKVRIS